MKNKRISQRVLSITLAVIMMVSTMMVGAYAAGENKLTIGEVSGVVGTSVSIPVSISLAEKASGIGFSITYDSNLTLDSTTLNTDILTAEQFSENLAYGAKAAKFLINWSSEPKQADGVLFYLNFTINTGSGNSALPVNFSSSPSSMITDTSSNYLTVSTSNGTVTSKNIYTITFESNGGSEVTSQTVAYQNSLKVPPEPTKTGFAFGGWYSDAGLTSTYNFGEAVVENRTLFAKWTTNNYTVSFETNGGSAVTSQTAPYGGKASLPTEPTKTGNTFAGWYSDAGLASVWDFGVNTVGAGNMTLYAKWTINKYTVTFDSNGGSVVSSQNIDYGTKATEPSAPVRTGYTFGGWYIDAGLTNSWDFNNDIIGDYNVILYAKWIIKQYTVIFQSNGGSAVTPQTIDFGGLVTTPAAPTKTGCVFFGWYSDSGLASSWVFGTNTVGAATMSLYAKWELLGDINQNGVVDLQDFILQQNAYLGKSLLTATQLIIGDMDYDGSTLELSDCMSLAQLYLKS